METENKSLQVLLDAGFPKAVAISMLKSLEPKPEKAKKKRFFPGYTKREKIVVPVIVTKTCVTCKTQTAFKRTMEVYSDEAEVEQHCTVSLCINCIKMFELMSKEELIALIIIQNHQDIELRKFGTAHQIKMAKQRTAKEWLLTKVDHCIGWEDRDKDDYKEPKEEE